MQADRHKLLQVALDELRMQMLGAQVLLGFQFEALFQEPLAAPTPAQQMMSSASFMFIVATLGLLLTAPCVHRIADGGHATERARRLASSCAQWALAAFAVALGANIFVVVSVYWDGRRAAGAFIVVLLSCWIAWYLIGKLLRRSASLSGDPAVSATANPPTSLHTRIDYLLTEARVILPGAQALLGFQFIVMLTNAFGELPSSVQMVHLAGLGFVLLAVMLLIAPAAIHRMAFGGTDDQRFLDIASRIVTGALLPLALGLSCEIYVAIYKLFGSESVALRVALGTAVALLLLWYLLPLSMRRHGRAA